MTSETKMTSKDKMTFRSKPNFDHFMIFFVNQTKTIKPYILNHNYATQRVKASKLNLKQTLRIRPTSIKAN